MKKTMFQAICILLSVLLLIAALPATTFAEQSGDYTYSLDSEGNAEITDVNSDISGDVIIPEKLDGHPVTSIGEEAFYGCSSLASITIPDGVTEIGRDAFGDCTSLTNITIPDSVTYIGSAFSGCISLTSITIPDSVTSISEGTFFGCTSLTRITIPDSLIYIAYNPFINTGYYNNDDNWTDGVLYIGNHLIACKQDFSGDYEIKAGTNCIAREAFAGCTSLKGITIPDSVTSISEFSFHDCSSLARITIPDSVTHIGVYAFQGCSNLSDVYYGGTEEQWNNIVIDNYNDTLTSAAIHFNSSLHNEHTWSAWTVTTPATYTEKGVETRTCSVCGTTETREIPKLGSTTDPTTPPTVLLGDVNGDGKIKANDARIILRTAAGLDTLTEEKIKLADMNGDGKIKANDARVVLRIAAGLE